jgi:hypothetical protein
VDSATRATCRRHEDSTAGRTPWRCATYATWLAPNVILQLPAASALPSTIPVEAYSPLLIRRYSVPSRSPSARQMPRARLTAFLRLVSILNRCAPHFMERPVHGPLEKS